MSDRGAWDWIDPLRIRGSRWDPAAIMRDLARGTRDSLAMIDVFALLLRRLQGRRVEIEGTRTVTLVIGEIVDAVPANEVVLGARGAAVPIWRSVQLGVHSIRVGELGAERAEVTALDISFVDRGSQHLSIASVSARVLLTEAQFADLVSDLDLPAEIAAVGTRLVVKPRWAAGTLALVVTPSVKKGTLHLRPESIRLLRWVLPAPTRLPMTLDFPLSDLSDQVSITDVSSTADGSVEATVEMESLEVPVDLRRMIADLGTEGALVAVEILSGDMWRRP